MSVQIGELRELAELRRDGATERIRAEVPRRATMNKKRAHRH